MPACYAHWHYGDICLQIMPPKYKKIVEENRDLYNLGVHGPDFFFFELSDKNIIEYGEDMHVTPAKMFFERCRVVYKSHKEKDAMLSYMLGFLTHFSFDSHAHGYVDRKVEVSNILHSTIESEFDKYLMRKNNKKPSRVDRSKLTNPTMENAKIMSYFFPFDEKTIYNAALKQKRFSWLISPRTLLREKLLKYLAIKINKPFYGGLITSRYDDKKCQDSNIRLDKLMNKAYKSFPALLDNFLGFLSQKNVLSNYFDKTFDKDDNYKKIPVLSLEDELEYKV